MVTNDQGLCLIRTSNLAIANFVNKHSKGIPPGMFLTVGGDPGARKAKRSIFHYIRKVSR